MTTASHAQAPRPSELTHLKARDSTGALYTLLCLGLTTLGIGLTQLGRVFTDLPTPALVAFWITGHVTLAFALLQWFVLLHECGHGVLFKSRRLNKVVGHMAGFFCVIPFNGWTAIHAAHHKWTGWQDLDPTTAALVPRELGALERLIMNFCWKFWIPAFSVLYRLTNFWNPGRLTKVVSKPARRRRLLVNALALLAIYGLLVWLFGVVELVLALGLGGVLSLVMLDPIMLSQHSHIPLENSGGQGVKAFKPHQQEVYTRSLRFPDWFSRFILVHFDAHELHHIYPHVPGYRLREIDYAPGNEAHWWRWIRMARRMPAETLLFKNRHDTGSEV